MASVLDFLRFGKRNAVTRTQLMIMTGLPDRAVRREIDKLREEGQPIFNSQDGEGYYLATADDDMDMMQCILRERSRRDSMIESVDALERSRLRVLNPDGLQLSL